VRLEAAFQRACEAELASIFRARREAHRQEDMNNPSPVHRDLLRMKIRREARAATAEFGQ